MGRTWKPRAKRPEHVTDLPLPSSVAVHNALPFTSFMCAIWLFVLFKHLILWQKMAVAVRATCNRWRKRQSVTVGVQLEPNWKRFREEFRGAIRYLWVQNVSHMEIHSECTYVYLPLSRPYVLCMYVCMYVCMCVCVCMYVCMYVYVCVYVCVHVCMYVATGSGAHPPNY